MTITKRLADYFTKRYLQHEWGDRCDVNDSSCALCLAYMSHDYIFNDGGKHDLTMEMRELMHLKDENAELKQQLKRASEQTKRGVWEREFS